MEQTCVTIKVALCVALTTVTEIPLAGATSIITDTMEREQMTPKEIIEDTDSSPYPSGDEGEAQIVNISRDLERKELTQEKVMTDTMVSTPTLEAPQSLTQSQSCTTESINNA